MPFQARDGANEIINRVFVPGPNQNVTVSGTTARTATDFASDTTIVVLVATTVCHIVFGDETVTATTAGILMPAGMERMFKLPAGATRVAAIQASSGGVLGVTEMR
ncbi:hypothetical protein [Thalassobaculum sp.]|uniref:hypothetical protein n=1 Tax=Thalassobaculum sp. TaxID=2022740 RepID=UPI0032EBC0A8